LTCILRDAGNGARLMTSPFGVFSCFMIFRFKLSALGCFDKDDLVAGME
jgi:hypothetical protein